MKSPELLESLQLVKSPELLEPLESGLQTLESLQLGKSTELLKPLESGVSGVTAGSEVPRAAGETGVWSHCS